MSAERTLADLVLRQGRAPIARVLAIVTETSPDLRVVPEGGDTEIGPIPVLGSYQPAIDDQVLLGLLANGSYICEGKISAVPSGGGGGGGMDQIGDVTLAADGSIDFAAISAAYTHLRIVGEFKHSDGGTSERTLGLRFNDDAGASSYIGLIFRYTGVTLGISGNSLTDKARVASITASGNTVFCGVTIDIPYYRTTNHRKVGIFAGGGADSGSVGRWSSGEFTWQSTDAINKITLLSFDATGALAAGSRATLYGVA